MVFSFKKNKACRKNSHQKVPEKRKNFKFQGPPSLPLFFVNGAVVQQTQHRRSWAQNRKQGKAFPRSFCFFIEKKRGVERKCWFFFRKKKNLMNWHSKIKEYHPSSRLIFPSWKMYSIQRKMCKLNLWKSSEFGGFRFTYQSHGNFKKKTNDLKW